MATLMTALYFHVLRPEDRVAVKPHAGAGLPRHPVPRRPPEPRAARSLPRLRRRPELPLAHQGQGRRRLLHRLRRPRRRPDALLVARPGLRPRPRLGHRPPRGPHGRPRRRRRDGRGQHLRGAARRLEAGRPQPLVGGRLQPPEPRRGDPRGPLGQARDALRQLRLGRRRPPPRPPPGGRLRRARRRAPPRLDRGLPEPALFRPHLPGRRGVAQAPPRRPRRPGRGLRAPRTAKRRRARRTDGEPRRPRPPLASSRPSRRRARTTGRRSSSPTRSRAAACRSPATRTTTPA